LIAQPYRCRVSGANGANAYALTLHEWNKKSQSNYKKMEYNLLGLMFLEILSHLISVAADGHAAPLPRMILRIVIEGVATGIA